MKRAFASLLVVSETFDETARAAGLERFENELNSGNTHAVDKMIRSYYRSFKKICVNDIAAVDAHYAKPDNISGMSVLWSRLTIQSEDWHDHAEIPTGVLLSNGTVKDISSEEGFSPPKDEARSFTQGYHLFRLGAASDKTETSTLVQLKRDHQKLSALFRDIISLPVTSGKTSAHKRQFFAPLCTAYNHNIDSEPGARPGAMLITVPYKDGWHIHISRTEKELEKMRPVLTGKQTNMKQRNVVALISVWFLCGQLYNVPDLTKMTAFARFRAQGRLARKARVAGVAAIVIATSTALIGIPLVIAAVAAGVVGLKRLYIRNYGSLVIKTETLSLSAMGSYARVHGKPSMFMYLEVDYPLGGPPFFFITGLSAGFGYNRALTVP